MAKSITIDSRTFRWPFDDVEAQLELLAAHPFWDPEVAAIFIDCMANPAPSWLLFEDADGDPRLTSPEPLLTKEDGRLLANEQYLEIALHGVVYPAQSSAARGEGLRQDLLLLGPHWAQLSRYRLADGKSWNDLVPYWHEVFADGRVQRVPVWLGFRWVRAEPAETAAAMTNLRYMNHEFHLGRPETKVGWRLELLPEFTPYVANLNRPYSVSRGKRPLALLPCAGVVLDLLVALPMLALAQNLSVGKVWQMVEAGREDCTHIDSDALRFATAHRTYTTIQGKPYRPYNLCRIPFDPASMKTSLNATVPETSVLCIQYGGVSEFGRRATLSCETRVEGQVLGRRHRLRNLQTIGPTWRVYRSPSYQGIVEDKPMILEWSIPSIETLRLVGRHVEPMVPGFYQPTPGRTTVSAVFTESGVAVNVLEEVS